MRGFVFSSVNSQKKRRAGPSSFLLIKTGKKYRAEQLGCEAFSNGLCAAKLLSSKK
jgi:hypothetical protein